MSMSNEGLPPASKARTEAACHCNCGYSCDRRCGLPIMECMKKHYQRDCSHRFDGETVERDSFITSVTCSVCGVLAFDHDIAVGP